MIEYLENYGNISASLIAIGSMIAFAYFVFKWFAKVNGYEKQIKEVNTRIDGVNDRLDGVNEHITKIYKLINPDAIVISSSPLQISDIGQEIAKQINADKMFETYKNKLMKKINKKNLTTPYDIQNTSMTLVKTELVNMINTKEINQIKKIAYEENIKLEQIMGIFGVKLRNHILKEKNMEIPKIKET